MHHRGPRRFVHLSVFLGPGWQDPIHPSEVAEMCLEALDRADDVSVDVGGPQVVTREEIARLAFAALGRRHFADLVATGGLTDASAMRSGAPSSARYSSTGGNR